FRRSAAVVVGRNFVVERVPAMRDDVRRARMTHRSTLRRSGIRGWSHPATVSRSATYVADFKVVPRAK
ncbi:MAG: hypothetical protein ABI137_13985, partial [Antricoccus sp.]